MKLRGAQLGNSVPWGLIGFKQWFSAGVSKIALMTWLVPLRRFLGRCAEVGRQPALRTRGVLRKVVSGWLDSLHGGWLPAEQASHGNCVEAAWPQSSPGITVVRLEAQAGPHSREVSWTSSFDNGVVLSHNRRPCGMRDTDVTSLENAISQSEKP